MTLWSKVNDVLFASAGTAATAAVGAVAAAPTWLTAVGQAAVVVIFTVKAIDKRLAKLHERVNEAHGRIDTINGKLVDLDCQSGKCKRCA